ncbi:T9SS type A sorting domain-containing protein [Aequorivita sp. F47161]|uniref:T9SS type A sorting domain-containing protein n=1 Tax=Aequorivita vitellina TaxID=2874475 RepID=A0A9X1R100_9FLAO|nr:T9SS type A sorting domain-containing protein [Aequorivita vitellina]MCG2420209.1 T9SS type A sorting domain-containing protein [Aequorivita vitellina]
MRSITILTFLLISISVFGQKQVNIVGTNNPVIYQKLQQTAINSSTEIANTEKPMRSIAELNLNNSTNLLPCTEENPNDGTFINGFNCSSASAFQTANDLLVNADENFTLFNITASIFANGGITNVDVNYYDNAAGLPGTLIGSEASVTIDNQTVIGNNFGFDVNEVEMTVTPFIFMGQAGSPTTYWVELSVTDGGATGSVFWVVTSSTMQGNPTAQFDAGWSIPDPLMDGVYIWKGDCGIRIGVEENVFSEFSYFPNPATESISLKAAHNIESISVYNLLGQELIRANIDASASSINLSELTTGAYIMKIIINGQTGTYKILKK